MNTAIILRVHRDFVGREFPFDKVYFMHKKHEEHFPRIFSTGLVMPVSKKMVDAISGVLKTMDGRKEMLGIKWWPFDRKQDKDMKEQISKWQKARNDRKPLQRVLRDNKNYFAVIPILFTRNRALANKTKKALTNGKKKIYPQYLVARRRRVSDKPAELLGKMLSARAYFMYGGKTFRPICLLCPRSIDSVVGDCDFGSEECYNFLGRIGEGDFIRGLKDYVKLAKSVDEPQLELEAANA
jgi:hypothetical protein